MYIHMTRSYYHTQSLWTMFKRACEVIFESCGSDSTSGSNNIITCTAAYVPFPTPHACTPAGPPPCVSQSLTASPTRALRRLCASFRCGELSFVSSSKHTASFRGSAEMCETAHAILEVRSVPCPSPLLPPPPAFRLQLHLPPHASCRRFLAVPVHWRCGQAAATLRMMMQMAANNADQGPRPTSLTLVAVRAAPRRPLQTSGPIPACPRVPLPLHALPCPSASPAKHRRLTLLSTASWMPCSVGYLRPARRAFAQHMIAAGHGGGQML